MVALATIVTSTVVMIVSTVVMIVSTVVMIVSLMRRHVDGKIHRENQITIATVEYNLPWVKISRFSTSGDARFGGISTSTLDEVMQSTDVSWFFEGQRITWKDTYLTH